MSAFTGEEKVDLLLKKVAYGVSKTGTSETKGPDGEPLTSFVAVQPDHVWKDATSTNVPFNTPTSTGSTAYVGVYAKDGSDSDFNTTGNIQAPVQATGLSTSANMPGVTFKRAWDTGVNNWIGPSFGGNYAVKVYVGGSSWNGQNSTMAANGVQEIIFGSEPSADWFFDYEAGVVYWTNEESTDTGTSTYDQSTAFTNTSSLIGNNDVVYVAGYVYIGDTGVGSTPTTGAVADGATTLVTGNDVYDFVIGQGYTSNNGDITSVTAGDGLTGGAASGIATLNVVGGDGITANADEIEVTVDGSTIELSAADGTGAVRVKDGGIITAKLADDAVTGPKIAANAVDTEHYVDGSIDAVHLASTNTATASEDNYLLSYDHSGGGFTWVAPSATANDVEITLDGGTGITFGSTFTTNQSAAETISVTLAQELQDIAGLGATNGLLTYDGTNVSVDTTSYLSNVDVTEGTDATTYKVLMTDANAAGTFTETFIDSNDLKFTPSSSSERGKLETGDLLVKGDLTVLGAGSVINLQQENVYFKDAILTLGIDDSDGDTDFTDQAALGVNVGIEAYKAGASNATPQLLYDYTNKYWTINNENTSNSPTAKIAQKFVLANYQWDGSDASAGKTQITHNLNTQRIVVQVTDSNDEIVYCKYDAISVNTIEVYIATAASGEFYDFVIIG